MTDLVERLRAAEAERRRSFSHALIERDWLTEAADEIEKLRAQVVALQSSLEVGKREGKKTP